MGIVGGNKDVIERAASLRKGLLKPVQFVEKSLDVTHDGTWPHRLGKAIA